MLIFILLPSQKLFFGVLFLYLMLGEPVRMLS